MTSDIVIRAEGLGKKYIIGHQSADRSNTFRDVITQNVKNFVRGAKEMAQGKAIVAGDELEEFWALKDVNFEIKRGDVVGIIGRNGAGKSTLLKVLSRITEPTEGRVEIKGRVASLLEVGTGFHPELSGRENVYLNGAILGMTRAEINRKFDEIVDFSGVEKFLDTPVKRYSSGMYVRLAFAVAAHLEPEVLVVDEVLAVGDAEFQKKCLGKMQDVAGQGRTVLFVSHNLQAVSELCRSGIYLQGGAIQSIGTISEVLRLYTAPQTFLEQDFPRSGRPADIMLLQDVSAKTSGSATFIISVFTSEPLDGASLELIVKNEFGSSLICVNNGTFNDCPRLSIKKGISKFKFSFSVRDLASGRYSCYVNLVIPGTSIIAVSDISIDFEHTFSPENGTLRLDSAWGSGYLERGPSSVEEIE